MANNIEWSNITFIFYSLVIAVSALITKFSKTKIKIFRRKYNLTILLFSLLIILVKGFNTTGRDISKIGGYYYNFLSATSYDNFMDKGVEIGYRSITILIRNITSNYNIYLLLIALATVIPIISFLRKHESQIDLFSTILIYMSVFLYSSFSPIRQCLAASIGLLAFDGMLEKKKAKSFVWIVVACSIHTSSIILIIPYILFFLKELNKKMIFLIIIAFFLILFAGKSSIVAMFSSNQRYTGYVTLGSDIGMEQIVYHTPLLILLYCCRKLSNKENLKLCYCYVLAFFCFGMLGYIISIFGRFYLTFLPLMYITGHNIKLLKTAHPKYTMIINVIIIMYCSLRFWLFISQYYNLEDLMPYTNMIGWQF